MDQAKSLAAGRAAMSGSGSGNDVGQRGFASAVLGSWMLACSLRI